MNGTIQPQDNSSTTEKLRLLLSKKDELFWDELAEQSRSATTFKDLIVLSKLRKRANKFGFDKPYNAKSHKLRICFIGGSTLNPLSELIEHLLAIADHEVELMLGDYNNYRAEILDKDSKLYQFQPDLVIILPDESACKYTGKLTDSEEVIKEEINHFGSEILQLCSILNENAGVEIILCNYILPAYFDIGQFRTKSLASDWNFRKSVNINIGTNAPNFVHVCDLEFLAYRLGGLASRDEKAWFESKQLCSPPLQVALANEIVHLINTLKKAPKKVLVLDLDNTLWGGVIGDDGLEGIELGNTSPRGEAFKAFQSYILSLTERGLLLAVCSKNDYDKAIEPFRLHPEIILREEHFVSFKANWEPKAQNLVEIANELKLQLDSFIFVDDNPAEINIVKQFTPDVTTILLGPDPADYIKQLQESRLFERSSITSEDLRRTHQYKEEFERKSLLTSCVDMDSYLQSLKMTGIFSEFNLYDLTRIAQLINKSNQFNLTTKRRTESELVLLMSNDNYVCFTMRLADRFGDHGLISVVIGHITKDAVLEIDTWLMSCRVLKRQVEEEVLNEIVRLARLRNCTQIKGLYSPTVKNNMVADLYPKLGFQSVAKSEFYSEFKLEVKDFIDLPTFIAVNSRIYKNVHYQNRSNIEASISV